MKRSENKHQQLQNALRAAYSQRKRVEVDLDSRWQMDTMRDIRRIGPLNVQENVFQFFDRFVWRFATVACAIVLILSVYAGFTGWNPVDEVAAQFLSNPIEFTVAQAFGTYESYE